MARRRATAGGRLQAVLPPQKRTPKGRPNPGAPEHEALELEPAEGVVKPRRQGVHGCLAAEPFENVPMAQSVQLCRALAAP